LKFWKLSWSLQVTSASTQLAVHHSARNRNNEDDYFERYLENKSSRLNPSYPCPISSVSSRKHESLWTKSSPPQSLIPASDMSTHRQTLSGSDSLITISELRLSAGSLRSATSNSDLGVEAARYPYHTRKLSQNRRRSSTPSSNILSITQRATAPRWCQE
jgi:hypothetical protein